MSTKKKYRCYECNWKFTRNYTPSLCPYCGRASVEEDIAQDASDIIREVNDFR